MRAVNNDSETSAAGTGKTFLNNNLIRYLNIGNVIAVVWTGIAASLMINGRTVHSTFQLPVPTLNSLTSNIKLQSEEATTLKLSYGMK